MGGAGALSGRAIPRRHGDASAVSRPHGVCTVLCLRASSCSTSAPLFEPSPLPARAVSDGASNTSATRVSRPRHPRRLPACNATPGASLPRLASPTARIHIFSRVYIGVPLREPPLLTSSPPTSGRPRANSLFSRRRSKLEMNHPRVATVEIPLSCPPPAPAGASGGRGARETGRASAARPPNTPAGHTWRAPTRGTWAPRRGRAANGVEQTTPVSLAAALRWLVRRRIAPAPSAVRSVGASPLVRPPTQRGTPPAAPLQAPFRAGRACRWGGCRGASRRRLPAPAVDAP